MLRPTKATSARPVESKQSVHSRPPLFPQCPVSFISAGSIFKRLWQPLIPSISLSSSCFYRRLYTHASSSTSFKMIAGLSKFINQYLAPTLSLTSLFLIVFAYLSPVVMLHTQVSLLTVRPAGDGVDGPSLFLGPLGEYLCLILLISPAHTK